MENVAPSQDDCKPLSEDEKVALREVIGPGPFKIIRDFGHRQIEIFVDVDTFVKLCEQPSGAPIDPAPDPTPDVASAADIAVQDTGRIDTVADPPAAPQDDVEITFFIKANEGGFPGILTKILKRASDGSLIKDSSRCKMYAGGHYRGPLGYGSQALETFAAWLEKLPVNTAIALGRLRSDLPDVCPLITKAAEQRGAVGVTRSGNNIRYEQGKPAFVLVDFDDVGMPQEVREKLAKMGGFIPALEQICPNFNTSGYVCRRSTSTVIIRR
jgi:hypothetical protein